MHSYRLLLILVVGVGTIGCDSPTEPAEKASGQVVRPGRMIVDGVRERLSSITRIAVSERGLVAFDQPDDPKLGVANVQTGQIARFGRSGGGPGEYPGSPSLAWRGDTVLLTGGARIAFSSSGTYLAGENLARQLMVQDDQDSSGLVLGSGPVVGPLDSNRYLAELYVHRVPPSSVADGPSALRGAFVVALVGDSVGRAVVRMPSLDQIGCQGAFCPRYLGAVSPTGTEFAIVGPAPAEPDSAVASLHVFDGSGRPLWSMRLAAALRVVPVAARDSAEAELGVSPVQVDKYVAGGGQAAGGARRGRTLAAAQEPATYPVVRRLLFGSEATIWLQLWDDGRWCALISDQTILGCIQLEPGEELRAASRDAIWIVRVDGDDVPSIYLHEVRWSVSRP